MNQEIIVFLSKVPGFSQLDREQLTSLASSAQINRFGVGDTVAKKEQRGSALHLVFEGNVQLIYPPDETQSHTHRLDFGPKSIVGILAFLTNGHQAIDIIAQSEAMTLSWTRDSLLPTIAASPALARFLSQTLSQRLTSGGTHHVGRYRILEAAGTGIISQVYSALDQQLHRKVALKVINHDLIFNSHQKTRFLEGLKSRAQLNHPNIVRVFDFFSDYSTYITILELVEGQTLQRLLNSGSPFSVRTATDIIKQIADALSYAHSFGLIHGDLNPNRCMVSEDNTVKVLDFGMLTPSPTEGQSLAPKKLFGSALYSSPELITENALSPASDIYALGNIAFQLLAGRPPFQEDDPEELAKAHLNTPPPDITKLVPDIPKRLATFVERTLEKDPQKRLTDWGTLLELLDKPSDKKRSILLTKVLALTYPIYRRAEVRHLVQSLSRRIQPYEDIEWQEATLQKRGRDIASIMPALSPEMEEATDPNATADSTNKADGSDELKLLFDVDLE